MHTNIMNNILYEMIVCKCVLSSTKCFLFSFNFTFVRQKNVTFCRKRIRDKSWKPFFSFYIYFFFLFLFYFCLAIENLFRFCFCLVISLISAHQFFLLAFDFHLAFMVFFILFYICFFQTYDFNLAFFLFLILCLTFDVSFLLNFIFQFNLFFSFQQSDIIFLFSCVSLPNYFFWTK